MEFKGKPVGQVCVDSLEGVGERQQHKAFAPLWSGTDTLGWVLNPPAGKVPERSLPLPYLLYLASATYV